MKPIAFALLALIYASPSFAGRMLVSHLDADYHASFEPGPYTLDPVSAQNFMRTSIDWVRNDSTKPFLFVESSIIPPYVEKLPNGLINGNKAFHADGEIGLKNAGYAAGTDYVRADAAQLVNELKNLGAYSAIVVASDFGGILTGAELEQLRLQKDLIASFVANGGGLYAMAESNDGIGRYNPATGEADPEATAPGYLAAGNGLLGSETPYGFLPVPVNSKSSYGQYVKNSTLTPFGADLGFTKGMLDGNESPIYFNPSPGWTPISYDSNGRISNMAAIYTGRDASIVPEPETYLLAGAVLVAIGLYRRQK